MDFTFGNYEKVINAIRDLGFICTAADLCGKLEGMEMEDAVVVLEGLSNTNGIDQFERIDPDKVYIYPGGEEGYIMLRSTAHFLTYLEEGEANEIKKDIQKEAAKRLITRFKGPER